MKSIVKTDKAPHAIGPYSQGVKAKCGDLLFLSGQIPLDPSTGEVIQGGIEMQTQQVLRNLDELLKAGGSSLDLVVKTTVYLRNLDDFPKMNDVYSHFFRENAPARSTVEVSKLPRQVDVEIDAIALVKG